MKIANQQFRQSAAAASRRSVNGNQTEIISCCSSCQQRPDGRRVDHYIWRSVSQRERESGVSVISTGTGRRNSLVARRTKTKEAPTDGRRSYCLGSCYNTPAFEVLLPTRPTEIKRKVCLSVRPTDRPTATGRKPATSHKEPGRANSAASGRCPLYTIQPFPRSFGRLSISPACRGYIY